jgi:hypothetical protein
MARSIQSFDDEFHPQIVSTFNTMVDHLEEKMNLAESSSIEDAERILDEACDNCVRTFQSKIDEIKASVKKCKPDPSSSSYHEDEKKYKAYVEATANGIAKSTSLFNQVFERLRGIVLHVVECIKAGIKYIWNQLNEAFAAVKALWN